MSTPRDWTSEPVNFCLLQTRRMVCASPLIAHDIWITAWCLDLLWFFFASTCLSQICRHVWHWMLLLQGHDNPWLWGHDRRSDKTVSSRKLWRKFPCCPYLHDQQGGGYAANAFRTSRSQCAWWGWLWRPYFQERVSNHVPAELRLETGRSGGDVGDEWETAVTENCCGHQAIDMPWWLAVVGDSKDLLGVSCDAAVIGQKWDERALQNICSKRKTLWEGLPSTMGGFNVPANMKLTEL